MTFTPRLDANFNATAFQYIRKVEQSAHWDSLVHNPGDHVPTYGLGYALISNGLNGWVVPENDIRSHFLGAGLAEPTNAQFVTLGEIADARNDSNLALADSLIATLRSGPNALPSIAETQGANLFGLIYQKKLEAVHTRFKNVLGNAAGNALFARLQGSTELVVLGGLTYINAGLVGGDLIRAMNTNDRAEAWYQIRYASNGGSNEAIKPGIAKRRYYEAELFGLYDNPAAVSQAEAIAVYRMFTAHKPKIESYEKLYGMAFDGALGTQQINGLPPLKAADTDYGLTGAARIDAIHEALTPAADVLLAAYVTTPGYGVASDFNPLNIQVSSGKGESGLIGEDTAARTGSDRDLLISGDTTADYLNGQGGNDVLYGGGGNDWLMGGKGDDVLNGGAGQDTYYYRSGDGNDRIIDPDGGMIVINDGIQELNAAGLFQETAAGSNVWTRTLPDGAILTLTHHSPWTLVMEDGGTIQLGEAQDDFQNGDFGIHFLDQAAPPTPTQILTGDLAPLDQDLATAGVQLGYDVLGNVIVGATPAPGREDTLFGSTGDDLLQGLGGGDLLDAGAGNDTATGNAGSDVVWGGAGDDTLHGGDAQALAAALAAGETQAATGARGDLLDGGGGDDTLIGSGGNDTLHGGAGGDLLIGGAGDDNLLGDANLNWADRDWQVTRGILTDPDGGTTYQRVYTHAGSSDSAVGGNDLLFGGAGNDWLLGAQGGDLLDGGSGNDLLFGGEGNDTLLGQDGDDELIGDSSALAEALHGNDLLDGGAGNDVLDGNGGDDILLGGAGDDEGYGGAGDDTLEGGAGNDWLQGGQGGDLLDGGTGNDTLFGEAGNDTLLGQDGDDELIGDAVVGLADALHGDDVLDGGAGNDRLWGMGGSDVLAGGEGDDYLQGDLNGSGGVASQYQGNDWLDGGAGNDTLVGDGGDDTLLGGSGDDRLFGNVDGSASQADGNDWLDGGAGDDNLAGGGGNDILEGGEGNDFLMGGGGDDTLYGGDGQDNLGGDDGDDFLDGGAGRDAYDGGTGNDVYLIRAGEAPILNGIAEGITDSSGDDTLQFSPGIAAADLRAYAYGADLGLEFGGEGVYLFNGLNGAIEHFQFADGTTLDWRRLIGASLQTPITRLTAEAGAQLAGGAGNDVLIGAGAHRRIRTMTQRTAKNRKDYYFFRIERAKRAA